MVGLTLVWFWLGQHVVVVCVSVWLQVSLSDDCCGFIKTSLLFVFHIVVLEENHLMENDDNIF